MKAISYTPTELTNIITTHQPDSLEELNRVLEDTKQRTISNKEAAERLSNALNRPVTALDDNQYAWDRSDGKAVILTITPDEPEAEAPAKEELTAAPELTETTAPESAPILASEEDATMTNDKTREEPQDGFFNSLLPLASDCTLIITVAQTTGGSDPELTVTITPRANNDEATVLVHPISVTATPAELDRDFAALISTAVAGNKTIQEAQEELEAAKKAEADAIKAEADAKKASAAKKNKSAVKANPPAKPAEPSLFDTPQAT